MSEQKKYNVIYVDPPWSYDNKSMKFKAEDEGNIAADSQYNLMTLEDLKKMPVKQICEKDAVCFMWIVNPLLQEGLDLLKAWGFKYKTLITWGKSSGTGYWFRGCTEHIVFGVRGNVKAFRSGIDNLHLHKSGKHSQKPDFFRKMIFDVTSKMRVGKEESEDEGIRMEIKRLEIFARSRDGFFPDVEYEGWDVFGNQVNNSISLPIVESENDDDDWFKIK